MRRKSLFVFTIVLSICILVLSSFSTHAQNTYLSFTKGRKDKQNEKTIPSRETNNLKTKGFEVSYNFTGAYIYEKEVEKTLYNFINIDGLAKMKQIGAPAVPVKNEIIAMPRGAKGKIVILNADYIEYDGFMVHPALEPARDTEGAPPPKFRKDKKIYSKNAFFPETIVKITNVGKRRGTQMANVQLRPVQFNPVTGKIRVYTNIKYKLDFNGGENSFEYLAKENSLHFTNLLKRSVINSESIPDGYPDEDKESFGTSSKNYILITHSEYLTQAEALANWKRQLGYSVEVVSQSSWNSEQVKAAIHDRYNSWTPKPDYFVILGDHTGSYAVPGEIHYESGAEEFATDLYYACMDGVGDYHPDMAHGRISVSSAAEATVVVNKIINYEQNPPTDANFYTNILNCAQWQDEDNDSYADRRFCHTSEDIRDYLQGAPNNYTSTRIYYRKTEAGTVDVSTLRYNNGYYSNGNLLPAELRDASFNWSGGPADITQEIDEGKFLVFHRDHGYSGGSGWAHPEYTTNTMESLNNGDNLPVIFSINCHTGEFQLSNCFAEKFLRMENKGAVGVVGAAYYSYSGYNDAISEGMIDAIWSDPGLYPVFGSYGTGTNYTIGVGNNIYTMGDIVNQGLNAMIQNYGDNKYSHELFHYFGDPAMKIHTANPNDNTITATHATGINCSGTSFAVSGSTSNATATLVQDNELISSHVLDGAGAGTVNYTLQSNSNVTLTISKHNCKPYIVDLTQTGTCNHPPSVNTLAPLIAGNSVTFNGDITADNGSAVNESGFVCSTNQDPVIGGGSVSQIQSSPVVTSGTFNENITLNSNTTYYYKAYATNTNGTSYGNEITFTTECDIPVTQASNFAVSNINDYDVTISWTSNGDNAIVVAKKNSPVNIDPVSGTSYSADSDFTIGEDISSGNIVVYSGTNNTVTVTNLSEDTEYYFAIYKYNDAETCYNTTAPETGTVTTTGHCQSYAQNTSDSRINEIIFNTINVNSSGNGCQTYTNNSSISTDVSQGQTYSMSLTAGTCDGSYDKAMKVFIDWNGDKDFDDVDETVYTSGSNASTTTYTTDVTIPFINTGAVRMRVVCNEDDPANISACGRYSWGETEDYTVNVINNTQITVSETQLDFGNVLINTSDVKTYTIEGSLLSNDIDISAPSGFEVSKDGNNYSGSTTLAQAGGTVSQTTVYLRFSPTLAQAYSGNITHQSTNASSVVLMVEGTGVSKPTASVSSTPSCNTGMVNVTSDLNGTQTFYLYNSDGTAELANSGTVDATNYDFTGQNDGTYTAKVEKEGVLSDLSAQTVLTNEANSVAATSVSANEAEICSGSSTTLSYTGGSGTTFAWYKGSCDGTLAGTGNNLSVSPTTTTTYYGRWENSCGNSDCGTIAITVNNVPSQPSVITGYSSVCNGTSSLTYNVTNEADTYNWTLPTGWSTDTDNGNSIIVTAGSNSGDITVQGQNVCGIGTESVLSVTVKDAVTPIIQSKWHDVLFCLNVGDTIVSYQWYKDDSEINNAIEQFYVTNKSTGTYYVMATDIYDCEVKSNEISMINETGVKIYPNPASDDFNLEMENKSEGEVTIGIYNSIGEKVKQITEQKTSGIQNFIVPVSDLKNGVYHIYTKVGESLLYNSKLIINR